MPHVTTATLPRPFFTRWLQRCGGFVVALELALGLADVTSALPAQEDRPIASVPLALTAGMLPLSTYASTESMPWGP
jgi:hypothetical protein